MAICTQCGSVIHDSDMALHVCKLVNIPLKGKEKIPQTIESVV